MSTAAKTLFLGLLIAVLLLGIWLAITVGERDVAVTNLRNAEAIIKERDAQLKTAKAEKDTAVQDFIGCQGELESLNKSTTSQSVNSIAANAAAQTAASRVLASVPEKIEQDRVNGQGPTQATSWVRELFK